MGCGPSRHRDPETVEEWLRHLGLEQYIPAFRAAGYDDLTTLAYLNHTDLKCIEDVSGEPVLPGHQKRLLLAAPQLRDLRAHKRRNAAADVSAPVPVPTDVSSNSPLQDSVGQLSTTTAANSQVNGIIVSDVHAPSPARDAAAKQQQQLPPAPRVGHKAGGRQRAPSIQARARLWSPSPSAESPAGADAAAAAAGAARGSVPAQRGSQAQQQPSGASSAGAFPGPTASGTFVVERPANPSPTEDEPQAGMGSFVSSSSQRRVRTPSISSRASQESAVSRMTSPAHSVSNAASSQRTSATGGSTGRGRGRGRGRGVPPAAAAKRPMPRWSTSVKGNGWPPEAPPLARGSRSSSGDGATRDPEEIKARLAARAAAREEASNGLRAHLRAIRSVTAELVAAEAARPPHGGKPIGPAWDTSIAEPAADGAADGEAADADAADAAASKASAAGAATPGTAANADSDGNANSSTSTVAHADSGSTSSGLPPPGYVPGHSSDGGFVQILVPAKHATSQAAASGGAAHGGANSGTGGFGSPADVSRFGGDAAGKEAASSELMLRLPDGEQLPGTPQAKEGQDAHSPDWTPWPVTSNPVRNSPPQTPTMFQGAQSAAGAFSQVALLPPPSQLPAGYTPVAAADATPPPHFAPSATVAEATGIASRGSGLLGTASLEAMNVTPKRRSVMSGPAAAGTAGPALGAVPRAPGAARSRDAETALQAAGRSVRARLGARISGRPSSAPVPSGDNHSSDAGSVGSNGSAHITAAALGGPMQTNMLYDSSPPPRPIGLRNMMQPQAGAVSPSMRPPAVSPMVRGAPQPVSTGSPGGSGSTSSSVTGPQVVLRGVDERVRRSMQQHGLAA